MKENSRYLIDHIQDKGEISHILVVINTKEATITWEKLR